MFNRKPSIQMQMHTHSQTQRQTHSQTHSQTQTTNLLNHTKAKTVSLFSQPYLDTYKQMYKTIVVVNMPPIGPLAELTRRVNFPPLSEFKDPQFTKKCGYALQSLNNNNDLMEVDEVPDLISFLLSNGYTVDTSITKMFNSSDIAFNTTNANKLICFITFHL